MGLSRLGFALLAVVSLCFAGCGGGGGGGGGGGDSSNASFSIDRTAVTFNSTANGPTPPAQQVNGTILNVSSNVFLTVTTTSNGVANASVELTGADSGALTIFAKSPAVIGVGTFTDNVVVSACLDSACSRPIPGSPKTITVTHTVTGANSTPTFAIGGSTAGLVGSVVLQDNLGEKITVSADGSFTFPSRRRGGDGYQVSVFTQPAGQNCTTSAGTGVVAAADVSSIRVTCSTIPPATITYRIGATVTGLVGSLVLTNNGADNLTLSADGTFVFATALADGAMYQVAVATQPASQLCTVAGGSGTIAAANVTVAVTCRSQSTIGGVTSGLRGTVVLQNNGGDNLAVTGNGTFTFGASLVANASYEVTVLTQPAAAFCRVFNGAGTTIGVANVTNVKVVCSSLPTSKYAYLTTAGEQLINGRTPSGGTTRTVTGVLAQFSIGPTGALTPLTPATVSGVTDPAVVAVDPSGKYVYVTAASSVLQYTIGAGGGLVPMSPASVTAGLSAGDIKVDPTGRFAYVVNFGDSGLAQGSVATAGSISQYSIAPDGHLVPLTVAAVTTVDINPNTLLIDSSGKYVYVAGTTLSRNAVILLYTIGSDGTLTPMTPGINDVGGLSLRAAAADPFGRSVFFTDGVNSRILPYLILDSGGLAFQGSVSPPRIGPIVDIERTGTYAYVGSGGGGDGSAGVISQFTVNANGTIMQGTGMTAALSVGCVVSDLSAKYLYACSRDPQNKVLQYTIGSGGELAPMTPAAVDVPLNPKSIAISP